MRRGLKVGKELESIIYLLILITIAIYSYLNYLYDLLRKYKGYWIALLGMIGIFLWRKKLYSVFSGNLSLRHLEKRGYTILESGKRRFLMSGVKVSNNDSDWKWTNRSILEHYNLIKRFLNECNERNIPIAILVKNLPLKNIPYTNRVIEEKIFVTWVTNAKSLEKLEKNTNFLEISLKSLFPYWKVERLMGDKLWLHWTPIIYNEEVTDKPEGWYMIPPPPAEARTIKAFGSEFELKTRLSTDQSFTIGSVWPSKSIKKFKINVNDCKRHIAIIGKTGSGKTTTAKRIISKLWELGYPYLIFDYHNEYKELVKRQGGEVFTPGLDENPLKINPLKPTKPNRLYLHISFITEIFDSIFNFTAPQSYMFKKALTRLFKHNPQPNLQDLVEEIRCVKEKSITDYETKKALLRRVEPLTEGIIGEVFVTQEQDINDLLLIPASIELGYLKTIMRRNY